MRRLLTNPRLIALAVVALALLAIPSCNSVSEEPERAEAVVLVTAISYTGTSLASGTDVVADLGFAVKDRNGGSGSFFNEVTFSNYTVTYFGVLADPPPGIIDTVYFPINSTGNLVLTILPAASKPGATGTVAGLLQVTGQDVIGNAVSFEAQLAVQFIP